MEVIREEKEHPLNKKQQLAVDTIEGPVLVISGPGTGKTELLSRRVINILDKTDAEAQNILCLTYTNAGVRAMRDRLEKKIGAKAHQVNIHTFHSFSNEIIQSHQEDFDIPTIDLNAATDLDQYQVLEQIIDELDTDHPLKRLQGRIYFDAKQMKKLYEIMKKEDWDPDFMKDKVRRYLEDLPNRDEFIYKRKSGEFQKGDVKINDINKIQLKMDKLVAAVDLYESFNQRMRQAGLYDFNDMINWVIDLFERNPEILEEVQEQMQFILVDEFQDTNGAQLHILNQLTNHQEKPNIFAVGDDDQSIYRFQGANLDNIQDYKDRFGNDLVQITLTDNYRSTQDILDAAMQVVNNNENRIVTGNDKLLTAGNPDRLEGAGHIQMVEAVNPHQETVWVGNQIKALLDQQVKGKEIAVLYRSHREAEALIEYLMHLGIPLQLVRKYNLFESALFNKLFTIMEYLKQEFDRPFSADGTLFEILHFDFFDLNPNTIADLYIQTRDLNRDEENWGLRKLANHPHRISHVGRGEDYAKEVEAVLDAVKRLESCMQHLSNENFLQFLQKLYKECGVIASFTKTDDKLGLLQELNTFHAFVEDQCKKYPGFGIESLRNLVRQMQEHEIRHEVEQSMANKDGVMLSTIQSAKGLEFEHVFMIQSNKHKWEGRQGGRTGTYSLPDNLLASQLKKDTEEERRIFYVGVTRAKTHLYVSYHTRNEKDEEKQISMFASELAEAERVQKVKAEVTEADMMQYLERIEYQPVALQLQYEEAYVDRMLENYTMSVSHLNDFLKCPVEFYYKRILKVPGTQNASAIYGTAVHNALDRYFSILAKDENDELLIINSELEPPNDNYDQEPTLFDQTTIQHSEFSIHNSPAGSQNLDDLLRYFDEELAKKGYLLTEKEYQQKLDLGHHSLPVFYEQVMQSSSRDVLTEVHIHAKPEGIPIHGMLDKLEWQDGNFAVVDYKTGNSQSIWNKDHFRLPPEDPADLKPDEDRHEWKFGGNYWRQAIFYAILMEHREKEMLTDPRLKGDAEAADIRFEYVDPHADKKTGESKNEVKRVLAIEEHKAIVLEQIKDTWQKIQNKEFLEGCGNSDCDWCRLTNKE